MKLALHSLYLAGLRWPLPPHRTSRICPALPEHEMGVVCCRRCGRLNPSYPHKHWASA